MPFSQYHIDPAHIEAMRSAFQKVCDALQLKCEVGDPMTEIIVNKIVAAAKAGETLTVLPAWSSRIWSVMAASFRVGTRSSTPPTGIGLDMSQSILLSADEMIE
jgi:hypothetical protein